MWDTNSSGEQNRFEKNVNKSPNWFQYAYNVGDKWAGMNIKWEVGAIWGVSMKYVELYVRACVRTSVVGDHRKWPLNKFLWISSKSSTFTIFGHSSHSHSLPLSFFLSSDIIGQKMSVIYQDWMFSTPKYSWIWPCQQEHRSKRRVTTVNMTKDKWNSYQSKCCQDSFAFYISLDLRQ